MILAMLQPCSIPVCMLSMVERVSRAWSSNDASEIYGQLRSNGQVFLITDGGAMQPIQKCPVNGVGGIQRLVVQPNELAWRVRFACEADRAASDRVRLRINEVKTTNWGIGGVQASHLRHAEIASRSSLRDCSCVSPNAEHPGKSGATAI